LTFASIEATAKSLGMKMTRFYWSLGVVWLDVADMDVEEAIHEKIISAKDVVRYFVWRLNSVC
jgi:hypothetical protein